MSVRCSTTTSCIFYEGAKSHSPCSTCLRKHVFCTATPCNFKWSHETSGHLCLICGGYGHGQHDCRTREGNKSECKICGGVGHEPRFCANMKMRTCPLRLPPHMYCVADGCLHRTNHVTVSHKCRTCGAFGHSMTECTSTTTLATAHLPVIVLATATAVATGAGGRATSDCDSTSSSDDHDPSEIVNKIRVALFGQDQQDPFWPLFNKPATDDVDEVKDGSADHTADESCDDSTDDRGGFMFDRSDYKNKICGINIGYIVSAVNQTFARTDRPVYTQIDFRHMGYDYVLLAKRVNIQQVSPIFLKHNDKRPERTLAFIAGHEYISHNVHVGGNKVHLDSVLGETVLEDMLSSVPEKFGGKKCKMYTILDHPSHRGFKVVFRRSNVLSNVEYMISKNDQVDGNLFTTGYNFVE